MKPLEADALEIRDSALDVAYAMRGGRTVLSRRSTRGPLAVQKLLYQEERRGVPHHRVASAGRRKAEIP